MLKIVYPICCGMDIHKSFVYACIASTNEQGVTTYKSKRFSTFTKDLRFCAEWLVENNCKDVCMESTGKYWIPVYNILEQTCNVVLAHPKYVKAPPHNSGKRNRATIKCQKAHKAPELVPAWRTDSDRQATPVGQNQIRQREQHIQLRGLLSQSSVARFSVPELPFDDREHVLNLCPN